MLHQRRSKLSAAAETSDMVLSSSTAPSDGPSSVWRERFQDMFGFKCSDLSSISSLTTLLHRPSDPASLGVLRLLFGVLMLLDTIQERGLSGADSIFSDPNECNFPLFNFLHPLPVQWMIILYLVMAIGCVGIALGLLYRASCLMFVLPYWYLFLLDKTSWNNHSYLFGLTGFMLLFMDANRYWSLDGLIWPKKRNAHVPLWNYTVLRAQIFLVYFLAGLKKLDLDWMTGYSMQKLSLHWVFLPFQLVMTTDQIDLIVVHIGGLVLDLSLGFLLFFDATRPFAFFFGGSFHLMNSQIFSIGMFPWTMLATMPLFCAFDWPRWPLSHCPSFLRAALPRDDVPQPSSHCLYPKEEVKPENKKNNVTVASPEKRDKPSLYHRVMTAATLLYLATQLFLPYSHFLTKGYNNWTNGLYGYSWDMMVHSWSLQHIKITYREKDTGNVGYLKPFMWTSGKSRWSSHSDMVKQYATCIEERLRTYNVSNVELYFDVWRSMNRRFQQRMFDPRVNILEADWGVFSNTPWILPLMVDLSSWREELRSIASALQNASEAMDAVFVADFPGLNLENYIRKEMNATLKVLKGEVVVQTENQKNYSMSVQDEMQLPADAFHTVYTVSDEPSCYMYTYVNVSYVDYVKNLSLFEDELIKLAPKGEDGKANLSQFLGSRVGDSPQVREYKDSLRKKNMRKAIEQRPYWLGVLDFWTKKYKVLKRSYYVIRAGVSSVLSGRTVTEIMESFQKEEERQASAAPPKQPPSSSQKPTDTSDNMGASVSASASNSDKTSQSKASSDSDINSDGHLRKADSTKRSDSAEQKAEPAS